MPDTSTVTTATAAETRAAGSKILGLILGGGSAIVDKLFDVGNFVTRTAAGYLISSGTAFAATGPTAGTVDGTVSMFFNNGFNGGPPYGLSVGVAGTGNSWLQCQKSDGVGTLYSLMLNPLGGFVGVGVDPLTTFHAKGSNEIIRIETTRARGTGGCAQYFRDPTGSKGYAGFSSLADDRLSFMNAMNAPIYFGTNSNERWQIAAAGHFLSMSDNALDMGGASNRIRVVYAGTGTINTSDANEKDWPGQGFTSSELSAAKRIGAEIGPYRWLDALAEKGDDARIHIGVRAQAVWAIMADEGLIPPLSEGTTPDSKYAFLCWDQWDSIAPVEAVEEVRDEEGNIVAHAQPAQPGRPAGDRFGVRTDQLALFLIAAQEARLAALESA